MPIFKRIKIDPTSWLTVKSMKGLKKPYSMSEKPTAKKIMKQKKWMMGDMLTQEQRNILIAKLKPKFKDEWEDKVTEVMDKIVSSPYSEERMETITKIINK